MIAVLLLLGAETLSPLMQEYNESQRLRYVCSQQVLDDAQSRELPLPNFIALLDRSCAEERSAQRQKAIAVLVAEQGMQITAAEERVNNAEADIRRVAILTYRPKKVPKLLLQIPPTPSPLLPRSPSGPATDRK